MASDPSKTKPIATQFTVCPIDLDHPMHGTYAITVEYRGRGRWAVLRGRRCLGADGVWDWELIPSDRDNSWLETHRFDLETALGMAEAAAPGITVNGHTAAEVARG